MHIVCCTIQAARLERKAEDLQAKQEASTLGAQKIQQLRTQLADAEARAASHVVVLQQHQQRRDLQACFGFFCQHCPLHPATAMLQQYLPKVSR